MLAPVGNFAGPLGFFNNPVSTLGMCAVTATALTALQNLGVSAQSTEEVSKVEKEICQIICKPLPGEEKDAPEQVCNEVCKRGNVITRVTQVLGPAAKGAFSVIDCHSFCTDAPWAIMGISKTFLSNWKEGWQGALAASAVKGACAIPAPFGNLGYGACLGCCGLMKYVGL